MRHSIKARFAMVFVGLMAFVLIATWCVNNWFLESFYTMDKVATLEKAYNGIDRIVTETEKRAPIYSSILRAPMIRTVKMKVRSSRCFGSSVKNII